MDRKYGRRMWKIQLNKGSGRKTQCGSTLWDDEQFDYMVKQLKSHLDEYPAHYEICVVIDDFEAMQKKSLFKRLLDAFH